MSDNYVLDILLAEDNDYMGTGFSRKQYLALKDLIDQYRHPQRSFAPPAAPPQISPPAQLAQPALAAPPTAPPLAAPPTAPPAASLAAPPADPLAAPLAAPPPASPPAQKPCALASPELPPQPISTPVPTPVPAVPARSYPPPPSVEDIEEVEEKQVYKIPLRNVKKMRQKFGAAKKMPRPRVSKFFENCIGLPSKFGAVNMCFSRDEDPDAWYTTMLNHKQKLYRIRSSSMQLDATKCLRCFDVFKSFDFFNFFAACKFSTLFRLFNFSTFRPSRSFLTFRFI